MGQGWPMRGVFNRSRLMAPATRVYTLKYASRGHSYVFRISSKYRREALRQLGRMAADKTTPFCWYDAAVVAKGIRTVMEHELVD